MSPADLAEETRLTTEMVEAVAKEIDGEVRAELPELEWEQALNVFIALRHAANVLRLLKADVEDHITALAPRHALVEGVGTVTVMPAKRSYDWRHDEVWDALASPSLLADYAPQVFFHPDTGEERTPRQAASEAVRLVQSIASVAYWRAGGREGERAGLRDVGLEPDEFCKTERGRKTVRVSS